MSPSYSCPRWRDVARAGAPLALAIALTATASAHATWSNVAPKQDAHCGNVVPVPGLDPTSLQSCVIVNGNSVQGVVKVTNTSVAPRRPAHLSAATRILVNNKVHRDDNCGPTTLAGGRTAFCYGEKLSIPGRRDVFATGFVRTAAGAQASVNSPFWKSGSGLPATPAPPLTPVPPVEPAPPAKPAPAISPSPPPQGFPAAWSNGPVDARKWRPRLRFHKIITCGDRKIPAGLRPQSRERGWTARTRLIVKLLRGSTFGWTNLGGAATGSRTGHIDDSFHYCGRAIDSYAPGAVAGIPVARRAWRASWRMANWAAHSASALKISQVIFYDRVWSAARGGWRPYVNEDLESSSTDPDTLQHRDHVHISVY